MCFNYFEYLLGFFLRIICCLSVYTHTDDIYRCLTFEVYIILINRLLFSNYSLNKFFWGFITIAFESPFVEFMLIGIEVTALIDPFFEH